MEFLRFIIYNRMNNLRTITMKIIKYVALFFCTVLVLTAFRKDDVTTIFMIGDSTMANKNINHGSPERGWGMVLQCFFDDAIRIDNHAVNGRSSKSFIDEGRWERVKNLIKPGDYVFIQFGHNDEKPREDRHTEPGTTFDENLRKFVRETRQKGGIPVLFNCVVRRNFFKKAPKNDDDEALRKTVAAKVVPEEGDTLYDTHGDYRFSPMHVAKEMGVVFIDANQITHNLEQGLGREKSKKLHMWFLPGEEPSIPKGRQDNTHYNIYGAHIVARMLAGAVVKELPALKKHRVNYDFAVAENGSGDFFDLESAIKAAPNGKKTTIQILGGKWIKPVVSREKKIKWVLREGAEWK